MALEKDYIDNGYHNRDPDVKRSDFHSDFMFGVGSSAYQMEGAWNVDGKGINIWDCYALRHPENIEDGSNACVTVDGYHKMKEDVRLLKKMGVKYYRFSISWSRILPGGTLSMGKNLAGINFYNKLIDDLLINDIKPFVTLFHWDLPNALEEEYMGFLSPKIVDDFVNYAEICFLEFGDRVKNWVTLNEPHIFTWLGYVLGKGAPGRGGENQDGDPETEPYIVAYHLLNCHASAYRKCQEDFKDVQNGQVGITLDSTFYKPYRKDNAEDIKAVEYAFEFGWFMEPLTSGNWPKNMLKFATTATGNHPNGRSLPSFTDEQKKSLVKSYDFIGINYYFANYARIYDPSSDDQKLPEGYLTDCNFKAEEKDPNGYYIGEPAFKGSSSFLCANELVDLLNHHMETYNIQKHIIITENGAPEENEEGKTYEQFKDDAFRLKYIKWHLDAIKRVNKVHSITNIFKKPLVTGYFVWSFTDSYEWKSGYTSRMGMIYVDYKNGNLRYPKNSAIWYKKFLSENISCIPVRRTPIEFDEEDEINYGSIKTKPTFEEDRKLKKAKK